MKPKVGRIELRDVLEAVPIKDADLPAAPLDKVREELRTGVRRARKFVRDASIKQGEFFILGGQPGLCRVCPGRA